MRTEAHAQMMAFLAEVASAGAPCPTTDTLAHALHLGESRAQVVMRHLCDDGLVIIEPMPANKNRRRVQVVATGDWTDWTQRLVPPARPEGTSVERVEDADAYMAEAMRGRRYEDVRCGPATGRRLNRPPTYVASQSSAA